MLAYRASPRGGVVRVRLAGERVRFGGRAVMVPGGGDGPDGDIDLVVVLPKMHDKHRLAVDMRIALADLPVPNDVIPTDPEEIRRRGDTLGGVLRSALREGRVIYERS